MSRHAAQLWARAFAVRARRAALRGRREADGSAELAATGVRVHFAGVKAVDGVDVIVRQGEILGLIGPNGAGKTTFVNAVTGFHRLKEGVVTVGGIDVTGWKPEHLARIGIARTFQAVRLFAGLSVSQNLEAAAVGAGSRRRSARRATAQVLELLDLAGYADRRAGALPSGTARRVGIGRAIVMQPSFLLLDEPTAGLNEDESDEVMAAINTVRTERVCGILVIEHDMRVIMRICDRLHVLNHGQTLAVGTPEEVRSNASVINAYLGQSHRGEQADAGR